MSISNLFFVPNDYDLYGNSLTLDNTTHPSEKALYVNGDTVFNGIIDFHATDNSTSPSTGALVINGGMGVKDDLFVGGTLTATNIVYLENEVVTGSNSTSTSTGAIQVIGGVGISQNLYVGGNSVNLSNNTTYGNNTVLGNLFVGGTINGSLKTTTIESTSTSTGSLTVSGGVGIAKSLYCNSINASSLSLSDNTQSTSTSTGALTLNGGIGIGNNIYVGGNANIGGSLTSVSSHVNSTLNATDTMSGAFVINGGAAIAKDLYVGGSIIESNPRSLYLSSSDWFLLYTMTTSQNLNILARTETNQITELLINGVNISSNLNNFLINSMPRFLVYQSGSTYNVFIRSSAGTVLNALYTDTPLIIQNYGAASYPNGYIDNFLYDTDTNTGFSSSDVFYLYNTTEAVSTSTGTLIVNGGISAGNVYIGSNGLTLSGGAGLFSTLVNDSSGNLVIGSSASGLITSANTQLKLQRVDNLAISKLTNAPIYDYGAICSMKKIGCVEGMFVNPNLYGTTTSTYDKYGSLSVGAGSGNLELTTLNGGANIRNVPNFTFFLYGDQYNPNYSTGSVSSGSYSSFSGDLAISNGILLNAGGSTMSQLKYITGQYVDSGQVGTMSCYFKTNSHYSNPPTTTVNIMQLYGNSANGNNSILLYHFTSGNLKLKCIDSNGLTIFDANLAAFNPVSGTDYFISVDWDFTTGSTQVFVNGTQLGSTQTATAIRTYSSYLIINSPATASFTISFVELFMTKQHTTTYTPPTKTNYNLVSFPSTGGIQLYSDTNNTTSGTLTCASDGNLYWKSLPLSNNIEHTVLEFIPYGTNTAAVDCSTYFQNALNTYDNIRVPAGTYLINTSVNIANYKSIHGDGSNNTIINTTTTNNIVVFVINKYNTISDLKFTNTNISNNIAIGNTNNGASFYSNIFNVYISNFAYGIRLRYTLFCSLKNIIIMGCKIGIKSSINGFDPFGSQRNDKPATPYDYLSNCNSLSDISINGLHVGEIGIFGLFHSTTFNNICCEIFDNDGSNNVIAPTGLVGTGIYIQNGRPSWSSIGPGCTSSNDTFFNTDNVISTYYCEQSQNPIHLEGAGLKINGMFAYGSTSSSPTYYCRFFLDHSVLILSNSIFTSDQYFNYNVIADTSTISGLDGQYLGPAVITSLTLTNCLYASTINSSIVSANYGTLTIYNTNNSTSSTTGALVVNGGLGIISDEFIGGTLRVLGTSNSTNMTTGSVVISGGIGISGDSNIGKLIINDTSNTTSTSTGSLIIKGGAYISKDLTIGTAGGLQTLTVDHTVFRYGLYTATSNSTDIYSGAFSVAGGVGISKNLNIGGGIGFFGTNSVNSKPTVSGSRNANDALASLITTLANFGLITDGTSV